MYSRAHVISRHLSNCGMTVIELLVAMVVMGVAIAGITELVWVNASWSNKLRNKIDNISEAKYFLELFGKDVRAAKSITSGTNQTVTLQIPVFRQPTFPDDVNALFAQKVSSTDNRIDTDTVTYQIVGDPDVVGQNMIMVSVTPGANSERKTISPAQPVLKGVLGPVNSSTGELATFKYVNAWMPNPVDTAPTSGMSGIVVNLEMFRSDPSGNQSSSIGIRREYFLRNSIIRE